jgi:predicted  nucleic acid-binding Zn-ribbon protein
VLGQRLKEMQRSNADLWKELGELRKRETRLQEDMECEKEAESVMEQQLYNLWMMVPNMFYISSEVEQDSSETIPVLICLPDGS